MIRDPSDGSVKEAPQSETFCSETKVPESSISGLTKAQADELERLNKSREWLKEYHAAVDRANRMNDKGEAAE
jgi:hypothetical protein